MRQTDHTAILLRYANYRDNDRMLTLFSPTRGRIEALSRGCRRPRSPLMSASEQCALGDYELYERGGHLTVVSAALIETFYPLRNDFDRLTVGTYLLSAVENVIQPGVPDQELFMLLLHTLSRLAFSSQPWRPLLAGFLLHFSACEGFRPRLRHCVRCGRELTEGESIWLNAAEGGLVCRQCRVPGLPPVSSAQARWMMKALQTGASGWVDGEDTAAPCQLLRKYVESRLDKPVRGASMLPGNGSV